MRISFVVTETMIFMNTSSESAFGLQYGWKSHAWAAGIPPFIIVILFKIYTKRKFARPFRYYDASYGTPDNAPTHPQHDDKNASNRFYHPALYEALHRPLVYQDMAPLLEEVYGGELDRCTLRL